MPLLASVSALMPAFEPVFLKATLSIWSAVPAEVAYVAVAAFPVVDEDVVALPDKLPTNVVALTFPLTSSKLAVGVVVSDSPYPRRIPEATVKRPFVVNAIAPWAFVCAESPHQNPRVLELFIWKDMA